MCDCVLLASAVGLRPRACLDPRPRPCGVSLHHRGSPQRDDQIRRCGGGGPVSDQRKTAAKSRPGSLEGGYGEKATRKYDGSVPGV